MEEGWKIAIRENPMMLESDVFIYRRSYTGKVYQMVNDIEVEIEQGLVSKPSLKLSPEMLQQFADELSRLNIKPKEASKTEGMLEAQTEHLKDLRTLLKLK